MVHGLGLPASCDCNPRGVGSEISGHPVERRYAVSAPMRDWQEGKRFMARAAGGVTAPHEGLGGRGRVHPRPVLPVTALHKGLR